jgi:hypothetical protein
MKVKQGAKNVQIGFIMVGLALGLPMFALGQNYVFGRNVRVNDDSPGVNNHMLVSPGQHSIAARGDTVYLAWTDWRDGDYTHVYFARSVDAGLTFGPNVQVDWTHGGGPSLAVDDSGTIHVSWINRNPSGGYFTYYAKSTDGGQSFLQPVRACDSLHATQVAGPSIAVTTTGRIVYVARSEKWDDPGPDDPPYQIRLARSTDGGNTFVTPNTLVSLDTTKNMLDPTVAAFGDSTVLVAWQADDTARNRLDILFSRSRDGGATFGPLQVLSDTLGSPTWAREPSIGVDDSGRVQVVYEGSTSPNLGIVTSDDTGATFGAERGIPGSYAGEYPSLFVARGGQLYVSWYTADVHGPGEWFTYSPDGGNTFPGTVTPMDVPVTESTLAWESTVTANEQGRAFVAWCDNRNDPWGFNTDVYIASGVLAAIGEQKLTDNCAAWCEPANNPCRGTLALNCYLPRAAPVSIAVYDLAGREVARLTQGLMRQGPHTITWNGRTKNGVCVESGVYIIRLQTPTQCTSRKVVMLQQ